MYDYDEYKEDVRDLYFDVSKLPGPIVKNQEALVHEIKNYDKTEQPLAWPNTL